MPPLKPLKRREFVYYLKLLGFEGPFAGSKHEIMQRGSTRLIVPNPHRDDLSTRFIFRLLKQAGVTREEWEALK